MRIPNKFFSSFAARNRPFGPPAFLPVPWSSFFKSLQGLYANAFHANAFAQQMCEISQQMCERVRSPQGLQGFRAPVYLYPHPNQCYNIDRIMTEEHIHDHFPTRSKTLNQHPPRLQRLLKAVPRVTSPHSNYKKRRS